MGGGSSQEYSGPLLTRLQLQTMSNHHFQCAHNSRIYANNGVLIGLRGVGVTVEMTVYLHGGHNLFCNLCAYNAHGWCALIRKHEPLLN